MNARGEAADQAVSLRNKSGTDIASIELTNRIHYGQGSMQVYFQSQS